jgi:indolepyruvate decarboxylase
MHDDDKPWSLDRRSFMQASAAAGLVATQATVARAAPRTETTCAGYIVQRMTELGANTLFGVPGATCDPLFAAAAEGGSGMDVCITASDLEAGYAADGYARVKGVSALSVSYGVGTMTLIGVIAGAYAERSAVCVFSGGPHGTDLRLQREYETYFSHSPGKEQSDLTMFKEVTAQAVRAEKAAEVPRLVDDALTTAVQQRRPVYVEIPKHLWTARCSAPRGKLDTVVAASGQEPKLAAQILKRIAKAKRPVLLLGVELQRYGLASDVEALVRKLGVPWATTMLGKTVIPDDVPGCAGAYVGFRSRPELRDTLETSDAVIAIGCVFGRQYRTLATKSFQQLTVIGNGRVRAPGKKKGPRAELGALLSALNALPYKKHPAPMRASALEGLSFTARRKALPTVPKRGGDGLTYDAVLEAVSASLTEEHLVVTDTSLSMYPAADLHVRGRSAFVCNGVWQSIGYSVGAAVGAAVAEAEGQGRRPVVLCGDGGFQMTAQSLSTMAKRGLRSIVVVLDNGHYGIEQFLLDKRYFTDPSAAAIPYLALNRWDYPAFARSLGFKQASAVDDDQALRRALKEAQTATGPVMISTRLAARDMPSQLHLR